MNRIVLASIFALASATASAQMAPPANSAAARQPHQDRALQMMYGRELQAHEADLASALALQEKLNDALTQIAELKKSSAVKPPANDAPAAP